MPATQYVARTEEKKRKYGIGPYSFWLVVPAGAMILGWLAWRSGSIVPGLAAHGVVNGLGSIVGSIVARAL